MPEDTLRIDPCATADLEDWAAMRIALWPDEEDLRKEAARMLANPPPEILNLIAHVDGEAAGFAEASIRRDYVNGCETSPVVFLEGIYVAPAHRHRGLARALVARVGDWGRAFGCTEFASDALLDNLASHAFHSAIGFKETERVVYFHKPL
jgi:aminoglycoside 6'-N-acetyltransferase I